MQTWIKGLASAAVGALLAASAGSAQAADPIDIVALYNLSGGGQASLDVPSLNGVKLKAKMINEAGGLLGGRMVNVTAFDTKDDTREAATAAKRAVAMKGVSAAIGFSDTTYVLAAAPLFQTAGIPFVTSGATSPDLPVMVGDEMFLVPFGDDVQAEAMAEYAYNKLGIHKIAIWTDRGMDYTTGLTKYFTKRFEKLGGKVVLSDVFMTSDQDFSALVSRLKSTEGVEGVYAASGPDTAGIIIKQIREAGLDLPIMGGDGLDTDLVVSVPGKAMATNVYFTTHAYVGLDTGPANEFRKAYTKEYGHEPENAFAALGFDAMGVVANAIEKAGSADPAAVTKALAATKDYEGVTGALTYPEGSHVPSKPVAIMHVDKGNVDFEETVTPKD